MLLLYKVFTPTRLLIGCGTTILKSTRTNLCFFKNVSILKNMKSYQQVREKSFFRFSRKESVEKMKEKDNVPDVYELIYRNTMSKYLLAAQIFSTALAGFVFIILIGSQPGDVPYDAWKTKPGAVKNEVYVYITALIILCVTMQLFVARMPLRIYHYPKQNQYTMISYGALPATTRRLSCGLNEVIRLEPGILPWSDSSYEIKDHGKVILIEKYFRTPADLNILLGYQKPPESDD